MAILTIFRVHSTNRGIIVLLNHIVCILLHMMILKLSH